MKRMDCVGLIGRFRPLHLGSALMLTAAGEVAEHVKIGIGSANRYDWRNPFTVEETQAALEIFLGEYSLNWQILAVPDFGHIPAFRDGDKWRQTVLQMFGTLDALITANPYVAKLLEQDYLIIHPASLIPAGEQVRISGTMVRWAMASGRNYREMMPATVAEYYEKNGLIDRFRREFGLETLARLGKGGWDKDLNESEEMALVSHPERR